MRTGGDKRRRTGDWGHGISGGKRVGDQHLPWVGDTRSSRVADERDIPLGQCGKQTIAPRTFVEAVVTDQRCLDAKMREHPAGVARILSGDQLDALKRLQRPCGDISQVADRCRDNKERTHGEMHCALVRNVGTGYNLCTNSYLPQANL